MEEADLGRRPPNRPQAGEINGTLRRSQRRFDFRPKPLISICFAARSDTVDLTSVRLPELATAISILRALSVSGLADDVSPQEGTRWPVRNVVNASAVTIATGITRDTARRRAVARRAKPPARPAGS